MKEQADETRKMRRRSANSQLSMQTKIGRWLDQLETPVKWMIPVSIALFTAFPFVLHDDWVQYQKYLPMIMKMNGYTDPKDMEFAFGGMVIVRILIFLMPACLLLFCACVFQYQANKSPVQRLTFRSFWLSFVPDFKSDEDKKS